MATPGKDRCVIFGGGGHARVVIDALIVMAGVVLYAILDRDRSLWNRELLGVPIRGGDELLPELIRQGVTHFVVGVGSVGDNEPRRRLYELGLVHGLVPLTIQHPSAICSRFAQVGAGSVLLAGSVINAGAIIGSNVIVNTGAIVEHDCEIGDHVHIATGARLASTVKVEAGAHVGAGAVVRQCISIGPGAIVGAGAVVIDDVPAGVVVAGVPARPIQQSNRSREILRAKRKG